MEIIAFMVIGIVVGLFARVAIPPQAKMGLISTCLVAMLGAVVGGGVFGSVFDPRDVPFELKPLDITLGFLTAILFVVLVGVANSRRAHA